MSLQVSLTGTLVAGPSASSDNAFPSGTATIPFNLNPDPKGYSVDTGKNVLSLNSPSAFVALPGVGALGPVTNAELVYFRTQVGIDIRLTTSAGAVVVHPAGLLIWETDPAQPITLIEAKGAGTIEYYACGNT
jgi:hypothetical protein